MNMSNMLYSEVAADVPMLVNVIAAFETHSGGSWHGDGDEFFDPEELLDDLAGGHVLGCDEGG
jgi:hypothetical protein